MDLVDYSEEFERLSEFSDCRAIDVTDIEFIPMSALVGDNVVHRSEKMPCLRGVLSCPCWSIHIARIETIPFSISCSVRTAPQPEFSRVSGHGCIWRYLV